MTLRDVLLDPNVFDDPEEFRPERWLPTNPNLEQLNKGYQPFSRGSRMCLGMKYAIFLLKILSPYRAGYLGQEVAPLTSIQVSHTQHYTLR
jgi:cytochrome P450